MAKGDVAITLTVPPDIDKLMSTLALSMATTRREVIIQAVTMFAKRKKVGGNKEPL
jgi:predicted transcriptional regulator